MPKYIDAEKIQFAGKTVYDPDYGDTLIPIKDVRKAIAQTPTADVQEIKHGNWIVDKRNDSIKSAIAKCSNCKNDFWYCKGQLQIGKMPYCPKCGAKMDGE